MGLTQKLGTIPLAIFTDASNNVGIGGSPSGSYKLDVNGNSKVLNNLTISSTTNAALIAATNSTTGYTYIDIINNGASGKNYQIGLGGNAAAAGYANNLYFDLVGVGNIMTLTSGRNVGIGTTSPSTPLYVVGPMKSETGLYFNNTGANGAFVWQEANTPLRFATNDTERMRITSGGDVCVGATSTPYNGTNRGNIFLNGTSQALYGFGIGGAGRGYMYHAGTQLYFENSASGGNLYMIAGSAGVVLNNGATSWTSNSDERLKDITGNIENAVDNLLTLRTIKHTWKSDVTKKECLALIAQDVEKVFPQIVDKYSLPIKPDDENSDETEYLGVRYTELIPVLVKAIQELSAKVLALENKS